MGVELSFVRAVFEMPEEQLAVQVENGEAAQGAGS